MVQITAFTGWYFTVSHFISSSNYQHKIDALDNMEVPEISTAKHEVKIKNHKFLNPTKNCLPPSTLKQEMLV